MPQFPIRTASQPLQILQTDHISRRRPPATGDQAERIRVKNRRKRYLELHPGYFRGASLELSEPLVYDRLIRRFMTAEEREQAGRQRDFGDAWEAQIVRSEARIDALHHPDPHEPVAYMRGTTGEIIAVEEDEAERAQTRADGWQRWTNVMTQKFVAGRDPDFDYTSVDDNEEYDGGAEDDLDALDVLEAHIASDDAETVDAASLTGQTGIQDF